MENLNFSYYYGNQADQFSFFRIPKLLFSDEFFDKISSDAKILYGVMLDRMSLSMKNGWLDKENRVYIIFTIEDVREMMRCGEQKAVKLLSELDSVNGIGLIEKKRQGLGKPNLIYVKNFVRSKNEGEVQEFQNSDKTQFKNCETEELQNCENEEFCNCESEEFKNSKNTQDLNCENQSSGIVNITTQELLKSKSNNTNISNTNINYPSISYPSRGITGKADRIDENGNKESETRSDLTDSDNFSVSQYMRYIKQQIEYDILIVDYTTEEIDEILDLILETICMKKNTVRIAGSDQPYELVKSKFMKLIRHIYDM